MSKNRLLAAAGVAVLCMGAAMHSIAQNSPAVASGAATSAGETASAPLGKNAQLKALNAKQKAEQKAEHKAERKQARTTRTAEIKSLEGAGYRSQQSDPDYPQNLLSAQKKAAAAAASQ